MTEGKDRTRRRRRRSSVGGSRANSGSRAHSRARADSLCACVIALGFVVTGWLYLHTHIKANTVGTALTQWAEAGHAPDGSAWDDVWAVADEPVTARFRASGASEHRALLSEWRAHQLRLDNQKRAHWYDQSAQNYAGAIAARPLSAEYWAQYSYSGLGSLSRVDRLAAADRALTLGHGRSEIQERALMGLLADVDLDVARLHERVALLIEQGKSPQQALASLERASVALGVADPRVISVRHALMGTTASDLAAGDEG